MHLNRNETEMKEDRLCLHVSSCFETIHCDVKLRRYPK